MTLLHPSLVEIVALGILMKTIIVQTSPSVHLISVNIFLLFTLHDCRVFFCKKFMVNGVTGLTGVVVQLPVVNLA